MLLPDAVGHHYQAQRKHLENAVGHHSKLQKREIQEEIDPNLLTLIVTNLRAALVKLLLAHPRAPKEVLKVQEGVLREVEHNHQDEIRVEDTTVTNIAPLRTNQNLSLVGLLQPPQGRIA